MSGSVLGELAEPLADAVGAVGGDGAPVRLERPADPSHGDYATRRRADAGQAAAVGAARHRRAHRRAARLALDRRHRRRRPRLHQPAGDARLVRPRGRPGAERGGPLWRRRRRESGAGAGRVREREPGWAADRGQRPQRRLRGLAGAAVRLRRPHRRPRVLLQRRRPPDRAVRRVAAGAGPRRGAARGRLSGRVRCRDRGPAGAASGGVGRGMGGCRHGRHDGADPGHPGAVSLHDRRLVPGAVAVRGRIGGAGRSSSSSRPGTRSSRRARSGCAPASWATIATG